MRSIVGDDPALLEKVVPDYPATGKRILQDDGTWLRTLQRPNVELVRTGIERVVPDGIVTTDGEHYPADVICYATGFRHNEFLASMQRDRPQRHVAARPVGGRAHGVPRHHHAELPESLLHLRSGDEPGLRRQPLLPLRVPGPLRPRGHARDAGVRRRRGARCVRRRTTSMPIAIRTRSASWCGPIPPSPTATTRTATGKVFTLSPWPLDQYWEWTRHIDRGHYQFDDA